MSYAATSVSRGGNAAARGISVGLSGALPAAQADYAFEPASSRPSWLSVGSTGTIWGTVPVNAPASATYTIKVTGKGIYAGETRNVTFTLRATSVPLPAMSYTAKTVSRAGNTAARTISVPLTNGLQASQADYAFEPPSSKPTWLSIGLTGIISGTVPTNATVGSATYTVKVTGKGIYAGETRNVTFTLDVSGDDFDTLAAAGNNDPMDIWSDGTTMWVLDIEDKKIYAYNMATKARDSAKDFNTLTSIPAETLGPYGIWSDGTTMWVASWRANDEKIYAYSMSTKARDSAKDFNTLIAAGNTYPEIIWSDGTTMWVTDWADEKIYAYSMSTKARDSAKDFNTLIAAGNRSLKGIWSDGTTMWVADRQDSKIYAYSMSSKARDSAKDFTNLSAAGNTRTQGIWSDGNTMWVADDLDDKIYAYSVSTKERTP